MSVKAKVLKVLSYKVYHDATGSEIIEFVPARFEATVAILKDGTYVARVTVADLKEVVSKL